jgi:dipeptide/tripeptide permease
MNDTTQRFAPGTGPLGFPRPFWSANVLEIFERMAWYGFYAVSSLYLTGAPEEGGLGLSSGDRGVIQAIVTFLLYLFPAVFGALADRFGFKKMFMASFAVMVPAYLALGHATGFWSFLLIYTLVAIGHGMFKPVVIATVAKSTNSKTASMGYGIFYMMVNIGGFLGPLVAGVVRTASWDYVFYASAGWAALNLILCAVLYSEPSRAAATDERKQIGQVLRGMVEVVGNLRFFITIFMSLVIMVIGAKWLEPLTAVGVGAAWIALNVLLDFIARRAFPDWQTRDRYYNPVSQVGEARYMIFLLLMAGFWASFNQIFITLPEYIRDYANTDSIAPLMGNFYRFVPPFAISGPDDPSLYDGNTVKPEYLINLNAFGIICFQVLISWLSRNIKPLATIVSGIVVTILSFLVFLGGADGWFIVVGILVFSTGEMLASPKSKEYAGMIAPPDKVGMYMGYFYWCTALGNLFGGILSGETYERFGPQGANTPDVLWWIYGACAAITAIGLVIYNRVVTTHEVGQST